MILNPLLQCLQIPFFLSNLSRSIYTKHDWERGNAKHFPISFCWETGLGIPVMDRKIRTEDSRNGIGKLLRRNGSKRDISLLRQTTTTVHTKRLPNTNRIYAAHGLSGNHDWNSILHAGEKQIRTDGFGRARIRIRGLSRMKSR